MNGFDVFRQIGKAWASAAPLRRPVSYFKEGRTYATGEVFCRGGRRAKRRRLYREVVKAAKGSSAVTA